MYRISVHKASVVSANTRRYLLLCHLCACHLKHTVFLEKSKLLSVNAFQRAVMLIVWPPSVTLHVRSTTIFILVKCYLTLKFKWGKKITKPPSDIKSMTLWLWVWLCPPPPHWNSQRHGHLQVLLEYNSDYIIM